MDQKSLGWLLMAIGVIGAVFSMMMDTSVASSFGSINNLGLMKDQQNYLILSCAIGIAGLALFLFGQEPAATGLRACPACAEMIKAQAVKCRYCGVDVEPTTSLAANFAKMDFASQSQELSQNDLENLADYYAIMKDGGEFTFNDQRFPTLTEAVSAARNAANP
jgi:hypothetical protein